MYFSLIIFCLKGLNQRGSFKNINKLLFTPQAFDLTQFCLAMKVSTILVAGYVTF